MNILRNQNTELTRQKESLEEENAKWGTKYDDLEKRMFTVEEAITKLKELFNMNGSAPEGETGDTQGPAKHKLLSPISWERLIYQPHQTQGGASRSTRAAKSNVEGSILDITDSSDDSVMIVDPSGKELGSRKDNGSNIPQTNGEKTTEGLSRDRTSFVDLGDDRIKSPRRKLRKLATCSVVGEANGPSLKSVEDTVDLGNLQDNSVMGTNSLGKGAVASANTKEGDSCRPLKRRQFVEGTKWKYDVDMLADLCKDDGLCLSAVCALHRHKKSEGSSLDVFKSKRGTSLIKYLTNRNPQGKLGRSISEVQKFNSSLIRDCRDIAANHFKELFEIYQKKEDPFFPHS